VVLENGLTVNSISSATTTLEFLSDTSFFGRPYFTSDTGGSAIIKKGAQEVEISFDREYTDAPIVSATLALEDEASAEAAADAIFSNDIRFLVSKKSVHGFTIRLNKAAPEDVSFSWIALAIKNAKLFASREIIESVVPVPEVSDPVTPPESDPIAPDPVVSDPVVADPGTPEPGNETASTTAVNSSGPETAPADGGDPVITPVSAEEPTVELPAPVVETPAPVVEIPSPTPAADPQG